MYEVTIRNGSSTAKLHSLDVNGLQRLKSCQFVKGVGAIPTASFTVYPQNASYEDLHERKTIIKITNTKTGKAEFEGYVLRIADFMGTDGIFGKNATCEGFLGFLCDSCLIYMDYGIVDVAIFLNSVLERHNALVSEDKQIHMGQCDIHGRKTMKTLGRSTFEEINENLVKVLGGELQIRNVDGKLYLDYLQKIGSRSSTVIELARNMKSLNRSQDSTSIITRLIPLGSRISSESEERLTITSVNDGCSYIDDEEAMEQYGVICAVVEFDDVTDASDLKVSGEEYLKQNNRVKKAFRIEALDLSTIGLDAEAIELGNEYRVINPVMNVNEWLRIIKITVDIYKPYAPVLEIGDKQESLTDIVVRTANYIKYEAPKQKIEILALARQIATELIKAGIEGYVVVNGNEILIMDTADKANAQNVWRWNMGGFGHSSTGYDGEFKTAITIDGSIVADFITAGVLRGIEISNGDGTFRVDPDGNCYASSINITGGSVHITTADETYSVIELNSNEWHAQYSPLQWVLSNDATGSKILCQAGAVFFYSGDDRTAQFSANGAMECITIVCDSVTCTSIYCEELKEELTNIKERIAALEGGTA